MTARNTQENTPALADTVFVAVDLGASSGRVIQGRFGDDLFELDEVHRFANESDVDAGSPPTMRWSTHRLFDETKRGLAKVARASPGRVVASVGVDTWGVDYGLFDGAGTLIEEPICYRDARTNGAMERVFATVPREDVYRATGIQTLPFNTLYQLHTHVRDPRWPRNAARLLTMPDVFHHLLCGSDVGEFTHASTTQMVRHDTRDWDRDLLRRLGIPTTILPRLVPPGTRLGPLKSDVAREVGLERCEVVAPASHDTASAVAGTPLSEGVAYVSSGTWSLVGVELPAPLVNDATMRANFTNEGGVEGTTRFLANVTGMWILEGCRRAWKEQGGEPTWEELDAAIARAPTWAGVVVPDDPLFFRPDDMVAAVQRFLRETHQPAPKADEHGKLARIVLESLALRYADVLDTIAQLTERRPTALRIIGGGSRHDFLNQATADVTGLEVLAGPAEATAIGNLLVQAIAAGRFRDLAEGRAYVAHMLPARRFVPRDPRGALQLLGRFRRVAKLRARSA